MGFMSSFNISGSGMTAQRLRMDIIAENIANAKVTRTEDGTPYRRKVVVLSSIGDRSGLSFKSAFQSAANSAAGEGVQVEQILEDPSELVPVYDPTHPDANADGYYYLPNVDTSQEMIDMMAATRAYEANVTAFNAIKSMAMKALEIGT
ncbi:MAG: flagellar basal body rod protein FlgC [Eubacteriales bacterium]|nr:flagellar basal body rod protein FlgC [Eubacteriales bacterium]